MYKYNLSKRLTKVENLIEPAAFLVDIGCDHGFLAIDLIKSGKVKKALCTDIKEGPLMRAKEHIEEYGLDEQIKTLLSDGLLTLVDNKSKFTPEEMNFDTACICGMGGLMGIKIIFEADEFFRKMDCFYLQLQSDLDLVRLFLGFFGYKILFEDMVYEEGKYYTVLKVKNIASFENSVKIKENFVKKYKDVVVNDKNFKEAGLFEGNDEITDSFFENGFEKVPMILKNIYDNLPAKDCVKYKYPYYDGMDDEIYESFLRFMINKYLKIKNYLPYNSDRSEAINKELEIMNLAYERYVK